MVSHIVYVLPYNRVSHGRVPVLMQLKLNPNQHSKFLTLKIDLENLRLILSQVFRQNALLNLYIKKINNFYNLKTVFTVLKMDLELNSFCDLKNWFIIF